MLCAGDENLIRVLRICERKIEGAGDIIVGVWSDTTLAFKIWRWPWSANLRKTLILLVYQFVD